MLALERSGAVREIAKWILRAVEHPDEALALAGAFAVTSAIAAENYHVAKNWLGARRYGHPTQGVVVSGPYAGEVVRACQRLLYAVGEGHRDWPYLAPWRIQNCGQGKLWVWQDGTIEDHIRQNDKTQKKLWQDGMHPQWTIVANLKPSQDVEQHQVVSDFFGPYLFVNGTSAYEYQVPQFDLSPELIQSLEPVLVQHRHPRTVKFSFWVEAYLRSSFTRHFQQPNVLERLGTVSALLAIGRNPEDPVADAGDLYAALELVDASTELMESQLAGYQPVVQ